MTPKHLDRKLCRLCGSHPARFWWKGTVRHRKDHDCCPRCARSLLDSLRAQQLGPRAAAALLFVIAAAITAPATAEDSLSCAVHREQIVGSVSARFPAPRHLVAVGVGATREEARAWALAELGRGVSVDVASLAVSHQAEAPGRMVSDASECVRVRSVAEVRDASTFVEVSAPGCVVVAVVLDRREWMARARATLGDVRRLEQRAERSLRRGDVAAAVEAAREAARRCAELDALARSLSDTPRCPAITLVGRIQAAVELQWQKERGSTRILTRWHHRRRGGVWVRCTWGDHESEVCQTDARGVCHLARPRPMSCHVEVLEPTRAEPQDGRESSRPLADGTLCRIP